VPERYIPAAGRRGLTALYDPIIAMTMREETFRSRLVEQVTGGDGRPLDVVDVGAGTGTLALALARRGAKVIAVDGEAGVLQRARRKAQGEDVRFMEALADRLPVEDQGADRVVMSLLLHHLSDEGKDAALAEARRVLRPGGRLHVADWGRPPDPVTRAAFFVLQAVDGFATTREHAAGLLPDRIRRAGFARVSVHDRLRTAWGSLELLSAIVDHSGTERDTHESASHG